MTAWRSAPKPESPSGSASARSSVKEIVTVVMALTMTNTLVLLLTGGHYAGVRNLDALPRTEAIFSALLILTIFRFYHGNIRHLDSVYGGREQPSHAVKSAPWGGLGVDFFVILTQSIIFAVMSFYADSPEQLLILFSVLLTSDVIWVLIVQQPSADQAGFNHQRKWLLNNVLALIAVLSIFGISGGAHRTDFLVYAGATLMLVNALYDFYINWEFYFPTGKSDNRRGNDARTSVFLAAPLTQMLSVDTGRVLADYRTWLEGLIRELEMAGHSVISAHVREKWGERLDTPTSALKRDLKDLREADAVVAHVGSPPSPGVQFELGAAATLGIPVVLLFDRGEPRPYLNPALPAIVPTDVIEIEKNGRCYEQAIQAVSDLLNGGTYDEPSPHGERGDRVEAGTAAKESARSH